MFHQANFHIAYSHHCRLNGHLTNEIVFFGACLGKKWKFGRLTYRPEIEMKIKYVPLFCTFFLLIWNRVINIYITIRLIAADPYHSGELGYVVFIVGSKAYFSQFLLILVNSSQL